MDDRSTDIFGPVEGNSDDSEEGEEEEEPEEEQGKEQISSIFEEEGEVEEDKPDYDPWRPLYQKVGQALRVVKEKLLPDESDVDEEAEEEVEAPVSYSESTT